MKIDRKYDAIEVRVPSGNAIVYKYIFLLGISILHKYTRQHNIVSKYLNYIY